jgi:hypothetical protein
VPQVPEFIEEEEDREILRAARLQALGEARGIEEIDEQPEIANLVLRDDDIEGSRPLSETAQIERVPRCEPADVGVGPELYGRPGGRED